MELPLPTTNRFSLPYWHTVNFIFGEKFTQKKIKSLLNKGHFYSLLHPADLISRDDLGAYKHSLERVEISLRDKKELLTQTFDLLKSNEIVLMKDIAENFLKNRTILQISKSGK